MGAMSFWHIVVVAALIVLLFGRGKVSDLMGDLGKGIRTFKKEMADETPRATSPRPTIAVEANGNVASPPDADGRA